MDQTTDPLRRPRPAAPHPDSCGGLRPSAVASTARRPPEVAAGAGPPAPTRLRPAPCSCRPAPPDLDVHSDTSHTSGQDSSGSPLTNISRKRQGGLLLT